MYVRFSRLSPRQASASTTLIAKGMIKRKLMQTSYCRFSKTKNENLILIQEFIFFHILRFNSAMAVACSQRQRARIRILFLTRIPSFSIFFRCHAYIARKIERSVFRFNEK